MVSVGSALVTRSLNTITGDAENFATSAPSILKLRSGMRLLGYDLRFAAKIREEVPNLPPHFRAPRQSAPVNPNQPHQLVARINRDNVIFRRSRPARLPDPVHQQGFDVWFH